MEKHLHQMNMENIKVHSTTFFQITLKIKIHQNNPQV